MVDAIHGEIIRHGVVCIEDDRNTAVSPTSAITMGTDCGTPFNVAGKSALELELPPAAGR